MGYIVTIFDAKREGHSPAKITSKMLFLQRSQFHFVSKSLSCNQPELEKTTGKQRSGCQKIGVTQPPIALQNPTDGSKFICRKGAGMNRINSQRTGILGNLFRPQPLDYSMPKKVILMVTRLEVDANNSFAVNASGEHRHRIGKVDPALGR